MINYFSNCKIAEKLKKAYREARASCTHEISLRDITTTNSITDAETVK